MLVKRINDMAIDKTIYNNGVKGMLSYWEIENLPRDYEVFKAMFKEATDVKNHKKQDTHKPMSKIKYEKRMLQVLIVIHLQLIVII